MWRHVFGSSVAPSLANGDLNAYCCVQFLVRSSRIRQRPLEFYRRALDYFGASAKSYHDLFPAGRVVRKSDALGRTPCQLAMYIWHVIFGEPMRLPRRQHDPAVPLFLKIQNIEIEVLDEEGAWSHMEDMVANTMHMEQGPMSISARVNSLFD
uniref:Uncharacterized protein n=1 Tax=Alexandrium catenella TaxID=2925 RepID=A0A7S1WF57_ALECA